MQKPIIALAAILLISISFNLVLAAGVPTWVKNTALWYGEGKISETEFLNAIKFLLENKIIILDEPESKQDCSGSARCISGIVTKITDGDTIEVDGQSIRMVLVDAPEIYSSTENLSAREVANGHNARDVIVDYCPLGSTVLVDEDDGQTEGSYDRILGVVYCNGVNLNEIVLDNSPAQLYSNFCSASEFGSDPWAIKHGC